MSSREKLVNVFIHERKSEVHEMVDHLVRQFPQADKRSISAVRQVAVAAGKFQRALLSDVKQKEKTPINPWLERTTSILLMVTPTALERIEVPKWEIMDISLIH